MRYRVRISRRPGLKNSTLPAGWSNVSIRHSDHSAGAEQDALADVIDELRELGVLPDDVVARATRMD